MKFCIAKDYTKTPGGRFIKEGSFSGEDFRKKHLSPLYLKAKNEEEKLEINFDGGYGYATSFLEEAFGGLVRELKDPSVLEHLSFISEEEPGIIEKVIEYIEDATKEI